MKDPIPQPPQGPRTLPRLTPSQAEMLADRFQTENVQRPRPRREAPLAAWLPNVLKPMGLQNEEAIHRVRSRWESIAGPVIAPRTFPGRVYKGTLTVHVENSVWLAEINRIGRKHLIKRAADAGLADIVTSITLKVGPLQTEEQES